jgi:hypothetical protein
VRTSRCVRRPQTATVPARGKPAAPLFPPHTAPAPDLTRLLFLLYQFLSISVSISLSLSTTVSQHSCTPPTGMVLCGSLRRPPLRRPALHPLPPAHPAPRHLLCGPSGRGAGALACAPEWAVGRCGVWGRLAMEAQMRS